MRAFFIYCLCIGFGVTATAQSNRTYDVEPFDELEISGPFYVALEKGGDPRVSLSGDEDDLEDITVKISGGTLVIRLEQSWRSGNRDRVYIRINYQELSELSAGGACEVQIRDLLVADDFSVEVGGASKVEGEIDVDDLEVELNGASQLAVFGSANEQDVEISGASSYDAEELESEIALVEATGASRAVIRVSGRLRADLNGASTLSYYGNPESVNADASGASSVKRRGG